MLYLSLKMKRKIIQMAGKTMIVSLPSSWVKKYGVKKGDEVEVEEQDKKIVISSEKSFAVDKFKFNTFELHPLIRRVLLRAYLEGYDEIEINFNKKEEFDLLHKLLHNELIGFEFVKQDKNNCFIKDVAPISEAEFDNVLRRIFIMIKSMGEDSLDFIKKKDKNGLEQVIQKDLEINKFSYFCLRLLNKKGYKDFKKTATYFFILIQLEKIADEYKDLIKDILKTDLKLGVKTLQLYQEINKFFNDCYEFHYTLNKEKAVRMAVQYELLKKRFDESLKTTNTTDLKALFYLRMIHSYTIQILGFETIYIKNL